MEKQNLLYICFIDYDKAFDRVNHEKLIEKPQGSRARRERCKASVGCTEQRISEGIKRRRVTRQGCVLSAYLFNLFIELIFRMIETEMKGFWWVIEE